MDSIREIGENIKDSGEFNGNILYDENMSAHTTMQVGGPAELFIEPSDIPSAIFALIQCKAAGLEIFSLGGGSNLIVSDTGIQKAVISSRLLNSMQIYPGKAYSFTLEDFPSIKEACPVRLRCDAGASFSDITTWCKNYALLGLESFSGLPGTLGGAVFMNARCYEKNISDFLGTIRYVDIDKLPDTKDTFGLDLDSFIKDYTIEEGSEAWGYKKSPFQKKNCFIVQAELKLTCIDLYISGKNTVSPAVYDYIKKKCDYFVADRTEKGHFKAPSAGSVFKNNHDFGKSSGKIIDECGLKGIKRGGAQVAPWHANFIINTGNATAQDILALVEEVTSVVHENTGFTLEREIIFV